MGHGMMSGPRKTHRIDDPSKAAGRPRPAMYRALGDAEPPETVRIGGREYRLERVFKHDSWAATALYAASTTGERAVCKFNRQQGIGPVPMRWLGRHLARNEAKVLDRMAGAGGVPENLGPVEVGGEVLPYAVARRYIEGNPLGRKDKVGDDFFPGLRRILDVLHARGMAYVDLHKRENVLVGDDGKPYLIDFQISFAAPAGWRGRLPLTRVCLRLLQRSDDYHFDKMWARSRPDQNGGEEGLRRPWWIEAHRLVARPFRSLRRRHLVKRGIRTGQGRAGSEHFTEEALRAGE